MITEDLKIEDAVREITQSNPRIVVMYLDGNSDVLNQLVLKLKERFANVEVTVINDLIVKQIQQDKSNVIDVVYEAFKKGFVEKTKPHNHPHPRKEWWRK